MNPKSLFLIASILTLGCAANAQSTGDNPASDTASMHHRGHQEFAHHEFGPHSFGHNSFGHHSFGLHQMIRYTPEQRQQVVAINKDYHQKQQDLFKQDNITLRQYKAGLLALEKEKKAKLEALLTPQQKDQLAARKKKMDENRQVMGAARLERLRLQLNLTDDQVAQIKTGQQNLHNQAQAIHDNDNLLPQEKRQQLHTLMMTRNDNLKTILTPDQYTKFHQLFHRRFGGPDGPGGPGSPWQGRGGFGGRTT
jgi:Spy/CpxP family protein refolding chaperone